MNRFIRINLRKNGNKRRERKTPPETVQEAGMILRMQDGKRPDKTEITEKLLQRQK